MLKISCVQLEVKYGMKKEDMIDHTLSILDKCRGDDLIVLPELWNVGFSSYDRYPDIAEPLDGITSSAISAKAKEIKSCIFSGSFVEKNGGKIFNTGIFFDRDGVNLGVYRKIHRFEYHSREADVVSPGHGPTVVDTEFGKIGLAICYDIRFPEQFWKMSIDMGAEFFLIAAAWPYPRIEAWNILNQARAMENVCFLASANLVGSNRGIILGGHSQIVDPWGYLLAGCGYEETVIRTEINKEDLMGIREVFPDRHRRMSC